MIDSGATAHMTSVGHCLQNYTHFDPPAQVRVADNSYISAIGCGDLPLTCNVNGRPKNTIMQNCLHVPKLKGTLFSLRTLVQKGGAVTFQEGPNCCVEFRSPAGNLVSVGQLRNGCFVLDGRIRGLEQTARPVVDGSKLTQVQSFGVLANPPSVSGSGPSHSQTAHAPPSNQCGDLCTFTSFVKNCSVSSSQVLSLTPPTDSSDARQSCYPGCGPASCGRPKSHSDARSVSDATVPTSQRNRLSGGLPGVCPETPKLHSVPQGHKYGEPESAISDSFSCASAETLLAQGNEVNLDLGVTAHPSPKSGAAFSSAPCRGCHCRRRRGVRRRVVTEEPCFWAERHRSLGGARGSGGAQLASSGGGVSVWDYQLSAIHRTPGQDITKMGE